MNPARLFSLVAAVIAGAVYGWRTERHRNTVKIRKVPPRPAQARITVNGRLLGQQPTEPFDPLQP